MKTFGTSSGGGRRSARRETVPLLATFTTVTRSASVEIVDVSTTGARLSGSDLPAVGEAIDVNMQVTRAFGTVMWCAGAECGVEFEEPLCSAHVEVLRERVKAQENIDPAVAAALEEWATGVAR